MNDGIMIFGGDNAVYVLREGQEPELITDWVGKIAFEGLVDNPHDFFIEGTEK